MSRGTPLATIQAKNAISRMHSLRMSQGTRQATCTADDMYTLLCVRAVHRQPVNIRLALQPDHALQELSIKVCKGNAHAQTARAMVRRQVITRSSWHCVTYKEQQ
jgi:hypothetical protein